MAKSRTQEYRDRKKSGTVLSRLSELEVKKLYPTYRGNNWMETKDNFEKAGYQVSQQTISRINKEIEKNLNEMRDDRVNEYSILRSIKKYESVDICDFSIDYLISYLQSNSPQWKYNLDRIIFLAWKLRNVTDNETPISTHDYSFNRFFGPGDHFSAVSDMLKLGRTIGLITLLNSTSFFNSGQNNQCFVYHVNRYIRDIILDYAYSNNIIDESFDIPLSEYLKQVDISIIPTEERKRITISSNLRLRTWPTEIVQKICIEDNPLIARTLENIEYENLRYFRYKPDLQRVFVPSIKIKDVAYQKKGNSVHIPNNRITRIGLRDTSSCSNLKCHFDNETDEYVYNNDGGISKNEYFRRYFQLDGWVGFDVPSSIWTLTRAINKGVLDFSDMYEKIYGGPFNSEDERDVFKQKLAMHLYFDDPLLVYRNVNYNWMKDNKNNISLKIPKSNFNKVLNKFYQNINNEIGTTYGSRIFVVESFIYSELAKKILDSGLDLIQIYDGFYVRKRMGLLTDEKNFEVFCKENLTEIIQKNLNEIKNYLS